MPCDVLDPSLPLAALVLVWAGATLWQRRHRPRAWPISIGLGLLVLASVLVAWSRLPTGCAA